MVLFRLFRTFFYTLLWIASAVLLGLSAARIHYTTHIPRGDPLNGGRNFYDHVVVELLVTSVFTVLWIPYILRTIHHRHEASVFHTFLHSLIGLLLITILFIAGAAVSNRYWSDLSWCWDNTHCRLLTVLLGFAWSCAILSIVLLLLEFFWVIHHKAWKQPMHGYYEEPRKGWWGRR